jgi:hypothetical protein
MLPTPLHVGLDEKSPFVPTSAARRQTVASRKNGIASLPCANAIELLSFIELASRQNRMMERVKGIEPSYAAWEAAVLPLNYTRVMLNIVSTSSATDVVTHLF